jgi:hypothetical protein
VAIVVLLSTLLGISLLKALAPPTDYDSLMYHLTVPARFLQEGRWVSWLANVPQSSFPFSLEMVFGLGMALGNDSVPALLSFGMVLLICLAIHDFAGKYIAPEPAGSFAAVAFLTSTYFVQAAGYASVDPLWVLAEFLAVYAFVAWTKHYDAAWLRLTGVLLGAGLAVKYITIEGCALIAAGVFYVTVVSRREPIRSGFAKVAWLAFLAIAVAFPWYLKNWFQFGNPVYPYLFGSTIPAFNIDAAIAFGSYGAGRSLQDYLLLPFNVYLRSSLFSENPTSFPTMLVWLLPLYVLVKKNRVVEGLVLWALARFVMWAIGPQNLRYYLPAHPALALSIGYILAAFAGHSRSLVALAARGALVTGLILSLTFLLIRDHSWNLPYALGLESRQEYLGRELWGNEIVNFVNHQLPQDAVVLFLSEGRGYYFQRQYIADGVNSNWPYLHQNQDGDPERIRARLKALGASHLLVSEIMIMSTPPQWSGDLQGAARLKEEKDILARFRDRYLRTLYRAEGFALYEILYDR